MDLHAPKTKKIHAYAKIALVAASLNMGYNMLKVVALFAAPQLFGAMVFDGIFVSGFLSAVSFMVGGHGLIKYKWPGETAYERARKPDRADLTIILVSFALTAVALASFIAYFALVSWVLHKLAGV